ncbi:MAG: hypothetical protein IT424_12425 [Pirellulales bacterium]|nr:hypothetical protein [Pirellulales bacterium]
MTRSGPRLPLSPAQAARLEQWNVQRAVDVHCHCLPGLDDGPKTLDESLALCEALVADGVTTVFATPHQLGRYDGFTTAARVRHELTQLQQALHSADIPLEICPGADVRIDERLPRLVASGEVLTAGPHGKHLLLELPHRLPVDPLPTISLLAEQGIQVILTHPERHRYLAGARGRLEAWTAAGAAIQITAGSLLGDFGALARQEAWRMVDAGVVSLIASDAHDASRPPRLSAALDALARAAGRTFARTVCLENPLNVYSGASVSGCQPT